MQNRLKLGVKNLYNNMMNDQPLMIFILFISVVFFGIMLYINININKKETTWKSITSFFKTMGGPQISSVIKSNSDFSSKYSLKDYYIQSSYNSCVGNLIKNDYVDIRPLRNTIGRGARLLDFEIWNIDNQPVVAAGANNDTNYYFKGTYNHLQLDNVLDTVNRYAFDGGICPNPNDPLFLMFRIKTKNSNIYTHMAKKVEQIFQGRLLSPKYGYSGKYSDSNHSVKLSPISKLMGKVIIICQDLNTHNLIGSDFMEFVNLSNIEGNGFINIIRYSKAKNPIEGREEFVKFNKENLTVCLPDTHNDNVTIINEGFALCKNRGIQFIAMHYANGRESSNNELQNSIRYHAKNLYAYVLKPPELRTLEKENLKTPKKQSKSVDMSVRVKKMPMYQIKI